MCLFSECHPSLTSSVSSGHPGKEALENQLNKVEEKRSLFMMRSEFHPVVDTVETCKMRVRVFFKIRHSICSEMFLEQYFIEAVRRNYKTLF